MPRVPRRRTLICSPAGVSWISFLVNFFFGVPFAADIDLATITDRMEVKRAVQSGNVQEAIEKINDLNPTVRSHYLL